MLPVNKNSNKPHRKTIQRLFRFRWSIAIGIPLLIILLKLIESFRVQRSDFISIFEIVLIGLILSLVFLAAIQTLHQMVEIEENRKVQDRIESALLVVLCSSNQPESLPPLIESFLEDHFHLLKAQIHLPPAHLPTSGEKDQMASLLLETICAGMPYSCESLPEDVLPHNQVSEPGSQSIHRYCLPLFSDGHPIGVISLDLPAATSIQPAQIIFLKRLSQIITMKILQQQTLTQLKTVHVRHEGELHHISQNLHDTVGQSIGFIRLKMEEIRHDFPERRYPELAQELNRVQTVIDEAYQQVRGLLAELHPNSAIDLTTALTTQAANFAQRAGFKFQINEIGQARPLPPLVKRQVLFILREALSNVEKHANASQVELRIHWDAQCCKITLHDNGVGFTPTDPPLPDHYGLVIMQERAQDISSRLSIDTSPGHGTLIILNIPQ